MLREKLRRLFVPHEENDFRPDILEQFSMTVMLLLVLLTFAMANIQALVWIDSEWMSSSVLPAVIVDLTNDERSDKTLSVLVRNSLLDEAARLKAEDMAKNGYFAHESPTGVTPWYWFDEAGYDYVHAGENLAVHFTDSSDVVEGWMNSPLHKANILNSDYTEIGVGTAKGEYKGSPTIFVVQLFGTPRARAQTPQTTTTLVTHDAAPSLEPASSKTPDVRVLGEQVDTVLNQEQNIEQMTVPEPENSQKTIETEVFSDGSSNNPSVFYTDTIATSRPGVAEPAIQSKPEIVSKKTPFFVRGVTQPHSWLQIVYGALALFVIVSLIISLVIESRRKNTAQVVYAGGLIAVMVILYYVHTALTSGVSIV